MLKSKSVPTLKNPGWIKTELTTGIDRKIRAKEIGKHHKRVKEQRANIDNAAPKNTKYYKQLRQRLFRIEQERINKKIENDNIELLRHLITLSHDAPNYKRYPKSSHLKFSQRMNKLTRERKENEIEEENKKLLNRLNCIKPSSSLTAINMAKNFKIHKKFQKQHAILQNRKRKQPDVIKYKRPKLTKQERTHFMKPLKRQNSYNHHDDNYINYYKNNYNNHRKFHQKRPMTANTYNYNKNKKNQQKRKRVESARKSIKNKTFSPKNQLQKTRKLTDILTKDMEDFGIETSPQTIQKLCIVNSPSYIIRPSKVYM